MKLRVVIRVVSAILFIVGIAMFTSVIVAIIMKDPLNVILALLYSSIITTAFGAAGMLLFKDKSELGFREGFGIVTFSWLAASIFGAIPFMLVAGMPPVDAFFETMSGFTTTGATIMTDIELQPKGLLWWRGLTQWLGGMGIVVLSLAILPFLGIGGMQLYKAEAPGPVSDQLTPRIASTAKFLWLIYVGFTAIEVVLLLFGGMNLFDAICHSFATLSTGGFSTKNASIGAFNSSYIEWVIIIFMFIAGTNFALHLRAATGKKLNYFKDDEFRFYFSIVIITIALITVSLWGFGVYQGESFPAMLSTTFRHASFNTLTIITTTGFATENFNLWPVFAKALLIVLMFFGACGGSTSGGMKVSRVMLLLRHAMDQVKRCFFPRSIANVRLNDKRVKDDIMQPVLGFFFIYMTLIVVFTFVICLIEPSLANLGQDAQGNNYSSLETSFSASVATLCNIGPGIGKVGPHENYAWMADQTKILLSFAMLIGRLEVYTVLVLLMPSFWRK